MFTSVQPPWMPSSQQERTLGTVSESLSNLPWEELVGKMAGSDSIVIYELTLWWCWADGTVTHTCYKHCSYVLQLTTRLCMFNTACTLLDAD
jgi:hypothetical protein